MDDKKPKKELETRFRIADKVARNVAKLPETPETDAIACAIDTERVMVSEIFERDRASGAKGGKSTRRGEGIVEAIVDAWKDIKNKTGKRPTRKEIAYWLEQHTINCPYETYNTGHKVYVEDGKVCQSPSDGSRAIDIHKTLPSVVSALIQGGYLEV